MRTMSDWSAAMSDDECVIEALASDGVRVSKAAFAEPSPDQQAIMLVLVESYEKKAGRTQPAPAWSGVMTA